MDNLLINPKRKQHIEPPIYDPKYKQRIFDLTKLLMKHRQEGPIQETLDAYISECMRYFKEQDKETIVSPVKLDCDEIIMPKKVFFKTK
jgi:hypothetical protein